MKGQKTGILCAAALLLLIGTAASAQGIAGTVKDQSGGLLPGVTVEAASPALIERVRTVTTDSHGEYKIVDLRPGVYSVTFTLPGFSSVKRDGIELRTDFTAPVSATMAVGAVTETLTVSAASPLVDVTTVGKSTNISRDVLDSAPVNKNINGFGAMTLGAILPATAQDVGGSKGEISVRIAFHGGRASEQRLLLDGMSYNTMLNNGNNRIFFVNPASAEEIQISNGNGGQAEFFAAGAIVNVVPRDGGNKLSAYFVTSYTGSQLQADNNSADLQNRGLVVTNGVESIYDLNGAAGGAFVPNKLWFFTAHRLWGDKQHGNLWMAKDANSYTFTSDLSRPVIPNDHYVNDNIRLTNQVTSKHKVTFSFDYEKNCLCSAVGGNLLTNNTALEASQGALYYPNNLIQGTWTYAKNSRLLFDAGVSATLMRYENYTQDSAAADHISVNDTGLGFTYRAPTSFNRVGHSNMQNYRVSTSYVPGSHSFKIGMSLARGTLDVLDTYGPAQLSYTFNNGTPTQLTQYVAPVGTIGTLRAGLGLYAQDQWTRKRMTLTYGLRYEYVNSYNPAKTYSAGRFNRERNFPEVDCVPCWHDVSPRLGAAYDLFGNGKTALRASVGRYVLAQLVGLANLNDPANTTVPSTTRPWNDSFFPVGDPRRGNRLPDCDLSNVNLNDECGRMNNTSFGQNVVTTRYDPETLTGWQHRPYNWQISANLEHELFPGVAVGAAFYRTWYGNFTVTDNLAVTPQDYSPYSFTAPVDSRLPNGGGYPVSDLYDLNPNKVGQVDNLVTFASKFGSQTEIYQGYEFMVNARLPRRATVGGGVNLGNSDGSTSSSSRCFVVDSPSQYLCDQPIPILVQFKMHGSYTLPWDLQVSANVQSLPGIPRTATYAVPNALIAPSLGRSLSSGSTVSVQLIRPYSTFEQRINQVDFRVTRIFRIGKSTLEGLFDFYNLFNANPVLAETQAYGARWLTPNQILDARLVKFGARFKF